MSKTGARRPMRVVALSGGVGGARLVAGLAAQLPAEALTVVVNTGDDFEHWGLTICPDLDTNMYTLAGLADRQRGWGLADETFAALSMVERYGGPAWFRLGDRDLATHLMRTRALAEGLSLTQATAHLCTALGVAPTILPMTDQPRRTVIELADRGDGADGLVPFQDWLVRMRGQPTPRAIHFRGGQTAAPGVVEAIAAADLVVIAPSNPYVSIDPIRPLDRVAAAVAAKPAIAVSPIVGGRAVKGPLAAMITALTERTPSAAAVVAHYRQRYGEVLSGAVVERGDDPAIADIPVLATAPIKGTDDDRARLAGEVLTFGESLL
ncbi:MAG: 2-phospho-L-lactate transferase [Myxococcota bacterium]